MTKEELRYEMKVRRRALMAEEIEEKSLTICKKVCELLDNSKNICLYKSAFKEVNTEFLIDFLRKQDKNIFFPVSNKDTKTISLCRDCGEFVSGAYGISEPKIKEIMPIDIIDTVIVPGVAFDKKKNRLGFGAGYYDRLLGEKQILKIGVCYDFQIAEEIDTEAHDIKMDIVITEKRKII